MKVIILCGGIGYRLKEETEFKPKPMVLVGGKPILWHIMKIYSHFGFNDFILALGYKGDYIKNYFLEQKYLAYDFSLNTKTGWSKIHRDHHQSFVDDFKITFVDTGEKTLVGERILKVEEYLGDDSEFMVTYGDGVSDVNIKDVIKFHNQQKTLATITGVHPRSKYGLLATDRRHRANRFVEKPILREWVNGGFMVFRREALKYFRENEMEHPALKRLIRKRQLSVYVHEGFWQAVDTYPELDYLNQLWQENPKWKVWKD